MRVLLIHPDEVYEALDAVPLAAALRDAGHDVLCVMPAGSAEIVKAIDPRMRAVEVGDAAVAEVASFAPEAHADIGATTSGSVRTITSLLKKSRDLLAQTTAPKSEWTVRAACERIAVLLLPAGANESLAGARAAWSAALVDWLRSAASRAQAGQADAAAGMRDAWLDAADRIASGLARSREMEGAGRLIQTLSDAILHQAHDTADLQTQLEARAATIQERDDLISLLRTEISGLGLQLDRLHRIGSELQEAHRVSAELRARLEAAESAESNRDLKARAESAEATARASAARTAEIGAELERTHRVAGELKSQLESRNADVASLRAQADMLREQCREFAAVGAELRRMHEIANELKIQLEGRSTRLGESERVAENLRAELESVRYTLREADRRAVSAAAEAARATQAAEELVRTRVELVQALARVETIRAEVQRVRVERDTLDDLVSARDAELADARTLLNAERHRKEAAVADRDRFAAALHATAEENRTLRTRLGELLASRWRKLGQRLGLAMVMPWEKAAPVPSHLPPPPASGIPASTTPARAGTPGQQPAGRA